MHRSVFFSLTAMFFLLGNTVVADTIFTWTDADGVKRFSNSQPPEDVENVQTIREIQADPDGADRNRQEFERMAEQAGREADRHFEEQAEKKARAAEAERQQQLDALDRKIEVERARLQQEIAAIDGRGLGPNFTTGMKDNLIGQIQEKIDRLENNPDNYFRKQPLPEGDQPSGGPDESDTKDADY